MNQLIRATLVLALSFASIVKAEEIQAITDSSYQLNYLYTDNCTYCQKIESLIEQKYTKDEMILEYKNTRHAVKINYFKLGQVPKKLYKHLFNSTIRGAPQFSLIKINKSGDFEVINKYFQRKHDFDNDTHYYILKNEKILKE